MELSYPDSVIGPQRWKKKKRRKKPTLGITAADSRLLRLASRHLITITSQSRQLAVLGISLNLHVKKLDCAAKKKNRIFISMHQGLPVSVGDSSAA